MGFLDQYNEWGNGGSMVSVGFESDVLVTGGNDPNAVPVVSSSPQTSQGSPFDSIVSILGSVGRTARDIGTAVGTARRDIATARKEYSVAEANARQGNALGQWWQYSTTQDKLVIGLALAGVIAVFVVNR